MALRNTYQDDVLTTIGIEVLLKTGTATGDGTAIAGAYSFGDLGAEANDLDATPLSASHAIKKKGLVDDPAWTLDYYYNEDDFDAIEGMKDSTITITVKMPNGTKFTNTAELSSNYVTGAGVGAVAAARASFTLGNADGWHKE